jgi:hypothetical protein
MTGHELTLKIKSQLSNFKHRKLSSIKIKNVS